jgi:hypothetical protein
LVNCPFVAVPDWTGLKEAWKAALPGLVGAHLKPRPATVSHGITHYRYRIRLAEASVEVRKAEGILPEGYAWVEEEALGRLLVSSLPRKIWRSLGDLGPHR